ncbi:farnesyl pyrophosphate synthase 2-like [Carya illinoinensis]|uniref:farnesyl pyrophosphate synthase 2-like n=1 Tax=Carya illinoinensis TaxID=32201 RepID=UPI001C71FDFA|nr:farnesyl pyrophosphate synthase 2-like [Carya illinoinensis]
MAHKSFSSIIGDNLDYEDFDTSLDQYLERQNNSVFSSDMEKYLSNVIEPKIARIIGDNLNYEDFDTSLDQYLEGQNNSVFSSDMEKYLSNVIEPKIARIIGDNLDYEDFDISLDQYLEGQNNSVFSSDMEKYLSNVIEPKVFDTGGCIIDPYQSSLAPEIVQALIYKQNWLTYKPLSSWEVEEHIKDVDIKGELRETKPRQCHKKALYKELDLQGVFAEYERKSYENLIAYIEAHPSKAV